MQDSHASGTKRTARTVNQQEAVGNLVPAQLYPVQLPWPELRHSLGYWLDAVFP